MNLNKKGQAMARKELYEEINRRSVEVYQKRVFDEGMELTLKKGLEKGLEQGLEQVLEKGRKEAVEDKKASIKQIINETDLSVSQIARLMRVEETFVEKLKKGRE